MIKLLTRGIVFLLVIGVSDSGIGWFLNNGLNAYMGLDKQTAVVCVGHSHTMAAIDDELLAKNLGVQVAKYALCGVNTFDRQAMLQHYFNEHPQGTRLIVYDVDHLLFNSEPKQSTAYRQLYPFMDNPQMGAYLREQAWSSSEYYARKILKTLRYSDATRNNAIRGHLAKKVQGWKSRANINAIKKDLVLNPEKYRIKMHQESINALIDTINLAERYNVRMLLVFLPTMDIVNSLEPEKYNKVIAVYEQLVRSHKNVTFINYNDKYASEYRLFYDSTHMNQDGQLLMTKELSSEIVSLIN